MLGGVPGPVHWQHPRDQGLQARSWLINHKALPAAAQGASKAEFVQRWKTVLKRRLAHCLPSTHAHAAGDGAATCQGKLEENMARACSGTVGGAARAAASAATLGLMSLGAETRLLSARLRNCAAARRIASSRLGAESMQKRPLLGLVAAFSALCAQPQLQKWQKTGAPSRTGSARSGAGTRRGRRGGASSLVGAHLQRQACVQLLLVAGDVLILRHRRG